jgi:ATP/maltotriose-dependent transcriptional regulator MalT/DNA-binding SARP family transcriptional activator
MPRSFRLLPPEPRPDLLARPRLMRTLLGRWECRVTVLVGGAGLGKTTVLAQALAENRLAPRGDDLWFGLEPQDADADRLARAVDAALTSDDERVRPGAQAVLAAPTATAVAERLWQQAPTEVCLTFDDVHRLPAGSGGAAWLAELIEALPANGHVVLASRSAPPLPLSRLGSHGAVLRLDDDALRFSPEELAGFADRRGVDPARLSGTGGWPALAELTASVDPGLTGAYMWEEVLEPLGDERRRVLAVLADLGGADEDLAAAALGERVDLAEALAGVPLVARTAEGWHVPHALWREAPGLALDPAVRDETLRRAVGYLSDRGRYDDAFALVDEAKAWDLAPALLRSACLASDRLVSGQLQRWLATSPPEVRRSSAGQLARGLLAAFATPAAAVEPLREAIARCRADGDVDAEMTAIAQQARLAWFRQDDAVLGDLVVRVMELDASTGHPAAKALSKVALAALADIEADDEALLGHLESIGPSDLDRAWELLVAFWAAQVRLGMGETEPIHRIVERLAPGDDPALRGAGLGIRISAWWAEGEVETVLERLPEMVAAMRTAGVQHNLYLGLNGACLATARSGDLASARRWFEESLAAAPPTTAGDMTLRSAMAQAYVFLAEGDEERATARLRSAIEAHGFNQGIDRDTWRQHIAIAYVLLPETRAHWDGATLRGHMLTARTLARAVVAVREGRAESALADLTLPRLGLLRTALDVHFAVQLAVGLFAVGRTGDGRTVLDSLGPAGRAVLRSLAAADGAPTGPGPELGPEPGPDAGVDGPATSPTGSAATATAAKALLAAVPAAPPHPTYLAVLGPMTLRRDGADGEPVSDPELRRSRLRALLAYLVSHRHTTRSAVAAALWPDLDEKAAVNNLGVTLNLLRRVLEPWRHSGEPPFLLRLDGQVLRLVTGEHLHLDVDAFDQHLTAAQQAESDGIPSLALEHDLAAVDLYRGDLFADLVEADWCTLDREHYRIHFVGAAIRAGQLLLGRGEPDRAEAVARRALAVDRWAEDAYAVLVGAAMARRDRAGAHRMYSHCVDALGELGAQPSEALRQLERRLQTATL